MPSSSESPGSSSTHDSSAADTSDINVMLGDARREAREELFEQRASLMLTLESFFARQEELLDRLAPGASLAGRGTPAASAETRAPMKQPLSRAGSISWLPPSKDLGNFQSMNRSESASRAAMRELNGATPLSRDLSGKSRLRKVMTTAEMDYEQQMAQLPKMVQDCAYATAEWYKKLEKTKEPPRKGVLANLLSGARFQFLISVTILVNAIWTIYIADYSIKNLHKPITVPQRIVESLFCTVWVTEIVMKLCVHRWFFFFNEDARWNIMDLFLATLAILDQISMADLANGVAASNLSFVRSMRIMRLGRVMRMFRIFRMFRDLRNILNSIMGSLISLFWCFVMLTCVLAGFALAFVILVEAHLSEMPLDSDKTAVVETFGSIMSSMRCLYMATTGGDDWSIYFDALDSMWDCKIMFMFYIAFFQFAVFNVLTGIFVESAMKVSKKDQDMMIIEQRRKEFDDAEMLKALVQDMDFDKSGTITWDEFEAHLQDTRVSAHLAAIGVHIHDAATFFDIMEMASQSAEVDIDDFVHGCMRMKGPASSIDLQTLAYEIRLIRREQETLKVRVVSVLEEQLGICCDMQEEGDEEAMDLVPLVTQNRADMHEQRQLHESQRRPPEQPLKDADQLPLISQRAEQHEPQNRPLELPLTPRQGPKSLEPQRRSPERPLSPGHRTKSLELQGQSPERPLSPGHRAKSLGLRGQSTERPLGPRQGAKSLGLRGQSPERPGGPGQGAKSLELQGQSPELPLRRGHSSKSLEPQRRSPEPPRRSMSQHSPVVPSAE